jgi:hypothetical protein
LGDEALTLGLAEGFALGFQANNHRLIGGADFRRGFGLFGPKLFLIRLAVVVWAVQRCGFDDQTNIAVSTASISTSRGTPRLARPDKPVISVSQNAANALALASRGS